MLFETSTYDTDDLRCAGHLIKIAFFKGGNKKPLHRFIRWWTKSKYSHVELLLNDETWVSISPFIRARVEAKIVLNHDDGDWDFIEFMISESQLHALKDFIAETTGDGYDWPGMLLSQIMPFIIKSRNKWYCSSWIFAAICYAGIIKLRSTKIYETPDLNPAKLHHMFSSQK